MVMGAHRDDHYIFIFQEEGSGKLMLDFKTIETSEASLLYIIPGQVHHMISIQEATGWFLAVDTLFVPEEYRQILEYAVLNQDIVLLDEVKLQQFKSAVRLIYDRYLNVREPFSLQIVTSLVAAFTGMFAEAYLEQNKPNELQNSRPVQLTRQFRALLLQHFKTIKGPAAYAEMLNISLTYLNEVVKAVTGWPVSYWIHHELILEAKRLLYYTDLSLKEIAFALGFTDHTYFSRMFTKVAGISAGKFRRSYR